MCRISEMVEKGDSVNLYCSIAEVSVRVLFNFVFQFSSVQNINPWTAPLQYPLIIYVSKNEVTVSSLVILTPLTLIDNCWY